MINDKNNDINENNNYDYALMMIIFGVIPIMIIVKNNDNGHIDNDMII